MTKTSVCAVAALFICLAHAGRAAPVRDVQTAALAARLFPALTAAAGRGERVTGALGPLLAERGRRMTACNHAPACLFAAAEWTMEERERAATSVEAAAKDAQFPPGAVPDDGVRAQALRELVGVNDILEVYGLGRTPRYPDIDGPDLVPGGVSAEGQGDRYRAAAVALADATRDDPSGALDPSVRLALALLDAADRTSASAFEPLGDRLNAGAAARAAKVDWSRYPFTALIVPGIGPDDLTTPLSATGKLNVRLAAEKFADGVAPYIVVTGSAVHPRGSRYVEALEMRRALIDRYGVPAASIVVEPYARHTTTNLRNATRLLTGLGAPLDRDALIVTYPLQSVYIESAVFRARNLAELGYQPGTVGPRLSPTQLVFRPSRASLRVDPADPLDP